MYNIYEIPQSDIVMLGDSITYGANWNELFNKNIINRGIGSDTTLGFLNRMEHIYKLNPKKVFIMGGINDLGRGFKVSEVMNNYKIILDNLKNKDITPYVQSTLYTTRKDLNPHVEELNFLLKKYCTENNIIFIDLNKNLSSEKVLKSEYTYDGVHLNASGYQVWKSEIKNYIN